MSFLLFLSDRPQSEVPRFFLVLVRDEILNSASMVRIFDTDSLLLSRAVDGMLLISVWVHRNISIAWYVLVYPIR